MKTNVYVDAFNLYYGRLRSTPYRWLNIAELCRQELPTNVLNRLRCFLARVSARPTDPDLPIRQQTYIRALETLPNFTIHYGTYLTNTVRMALAHPAPGGPTTVEVLKTEEKGSDVNLATYLLLDAFDNDYDAAVVISNDSDLAEPIRVARQRFGKRVVVLAPVRLPRKPSVELRKAASRCQVIQDASLAASQFPPILTDAQGRTITKPAVW
jgi:uncharacterized LabA/DUF88 family protein